MDDKTKKLAMETIKLINSTVTLPEHGSTFFSVNKHNLEKKLELWCVGPLEIGQIMLSGVFDPFDSAAVPQVIVVIESTGQNVSKFIIGGNGHWDYCEIGFEHRQLIPSE